MIPKCPWISFCGGTMRQTIRPNLSLCLTHTLYPRFRACRAEACARRRIFFRIPPRTRHVSPHPGVFFSQAFPIAISAFCRCLADGHFNTLPTVKRVHPSLG